VLLAVAPALLVGQPVAAESPGTALSLTPNLLSVEVREDERNELSEARFNSGMGLRMRNRVLQFAVDYKLQSQLKDSADEAEVSQRLGASLYSTALNELLGLNADIRAGSTIKAGGDSYLYSVTPGISKSLAELGSFSLQYEYLLDKPRAEAAEQEKSGYRMGLNGSAREGRLTWKGNYRTTDVFGGVDQLRSTELLEFNSGYQLAPELRLEVSGRSKDETRFDGGLANDVYHETRYGAGVSWKPSPHYALAFKVNKLDESSDDTEELFGSGSVSWFPQRNMEFTMSYGNHLVEGARGVMFSTKIDLNDS
jgi:hypothetical protein